MKYARYIGIIAAVILIVCCFIPLAYYPDINENFTGFYSRENAYGKPGKACLFLSVCAIILFLTPKLWALRVNQVLGVILFTYSVKTYLLFAGSYAGIHPQVKPGLIGLLLFSFVLLVSSLFSRAVMKEENNGTATATAEDNPTT